MKEEDFYNIIGQNIKKYRNEYNKKYGKMTQELLAEKLNTSVSFISKLESKRTYQSISIPTLYKISIILKKLLAIKKIKRIMEKKIPLEFQKILKSVCTKKYII